MAGYESGKMKEIDNRETKNLCPIIIRELGECSGESSAKI
jgi:hypothetical protein